MSKKSDRIAKLRDLISQMGHPPQRYERWHKELDQLWENKPKEPETARRRRIALERAGYANGVLPDGLVYMHGAVMSEEEGRVISDRMTSLGDAKPRAKSGAYYQLAAQYLSELRKLEGSNG